MSHSVKELGDVVSFTTLAAYAAGILPAIATLLTIVWLVIRIFESDTVQGALKRDKAKQDRPSRG